MCVYVHVIVIFTLFWKYFLNIYFRSSLSVAAGLNLQMECYNLVLFSPLYIGSGGVTGNAVSDTSTELQAIGRVYRPGQPKEKVNVFRIELLGPDGEECLDGKLIRRNTDQETVEMAINSAD